MPSITETISELDGLREKATQGNWKDADQPYCEVHTIDKKDCDYIIALHNAYPALRQMVLDGERYKVAGEALAKAVEEYVISHTADHYCAYAGDIDHFIAEQLSAYRSAIEKNV